MILKLLLVVTVIAVIYFLFIKKKPILKNSNNKEESQKDEIQSNDMVECSSCGIYCELDDVIISNNKYYCSQECLEKA